VKDGNNNAVSLERQDLDTRPATPTSLTSQTATPLSRASTPSKNPGIGGLVLNGSGDPVENAEVQIQLIEPAICHLYTDEDGWYMWQYKMDRARRAFTVKMTPPLPYAQTTQADGDTEGQWLPHRELHGAVRYTFED
jgi:hypothetical protein